MDYCITIKISTKEVLQHENVYNTMLRQKVEYFICKIMCLWGWEMKELHEKSKNSFFGW